KRLPTPCAAIPTPCAAMLSIHPPSVRIRDIRGPLGPGLRLGPQCDPGSAWCARAGGACNAVHYEAEPRNETNPTIESPPIPTHPIAEHAGGRIEALENAGLAFSRRGKVARLPPTVARDFPI